MEYVLESDSREIAEKFLDYMINMSNFWRDSVAMVAYEPRLFFGAEEYSRKKYAIKKAQKAAAKVIKMEKEVLDGFSFFARN